MSDQEVFGAVRVRIRRNSDDEVREYIHEPVHMTDFHEDAALFRFMWGEGNYSCDCNRHYFFQRAAGVAESDLTDVECGETEYTVLEAIGSDGTLIYKDPEPRE